MKISGWSLIRLFTLFVYISMFAPIVVVIILSFNPMEFVIFGLPGLGNIRRRQCSAGSSTQRCNQAFWQGDCGP